MVSDNDRRGINATPEEFYLHRGRTGGSTINLLIERMHGRKATEDEKQRIYKRKSELLHFIMERRYN